MKLTIKSALLVVVTMTLTGCGDGKRNTFKLVGELPPDFSYTASTWYVPDPDTKCEVTDWRRTMPSFNKRWRTEYNPVAVVEIRKVIKGCQMILDRIKITINATYGDSIFQQGGDRANIGVYVSLPERHRRTTVSETEDIFYGECEWLFRTATPERHIWKVLDCKKDNERGEAGVGKPFAAYTLDQLPGKIIRMNVRLASVERPYFKDTWVKFSDGWRRCLGKGKQDVRGYCRGNYTDFSDFIMPDGRSCNVYPGCGGGL